MQLTQLNIYPAKSMRGIALERAVVTSFGLHNDRRWMLVDESGKFITQRKYAAMAWIESRLTDCGIIFQAPEMEPLVLSLDQLDQSGIATVWRDEVPVLRAPAVASQWFERFLGVACHLVYMPETSFRQVDRNYFSADQRVGFADGFPFLLISEASLEDLNGRLAESVPMTRFRPNLVISGCAAYEEDRWKKVRIGSIEFDIVKPCSRCVMTTIDAQTGRKGVEPLATLAKYRKNDFGVCFGQNLVHKGVGELRVGDSVEFIG